jgi:tetratricopeptide (TPR) repeat protein
MLCYTAAHDETDHDCKSLVWHCWPARQPSLRQLPWRKVPARPIPPFTGPNLHNPDANADPEEVLDRLFAQLRQADSEDTAKVLESAIQAMWMRSGSDTADVLMKQAGAAIEKKSYGSALAILDTVVELNPDFAEGWNRRATVHFLRGDYTNSQADIERVLELEPRHYGALSGLGAIEKERGNGRAALRALRRARTINPKLEDIDDRIRKLEQEYDQEI